MPDHVDPVASSQEATANTISPPADTPFAVMEKTLGPQSVDDGMGHRARRIPVTVLWVMAVVIDVVDQISKQWELSALSD